MTKTLSISPDLALPLELATQTAAIFGIRGSGKTNTAGVIAEELLDRDYPVVIIDPTDAWWGLRSSRDGRSEGYPVLIFGGSHGDLPLQETDGKVVAEFVVQEQIPLVLSLRHLRKNAQRRFVTEFSEELFHLKGRPEYRSPLTVVIDEAPLFVPQKVLGEAARTVGAVEDLIARGRNAGFGVVLISQRPATINKDVLSQADTIITHRITSPHDRNALNDWIEENASIEQRKQVLESLAKLQNGRAWVWAPQLGIIKDIQVRLRKTFDSSATPKPGEKIRPPKKLAEVDLESLKGRLAASVEKAKAEDPRELKKKVADLERAFKNAQAEREKVEHRVKEKRVEIPVVKAEHVKRVEASIAQLQKVVAEGNKHSGKLLEYAAIIQAAVTQALEVSKELVKIVVPTLATQRPAASLSRNGPVAFTQQPVAKTHQSGADLQRRASRSAPGGSLPGGEKKILTAIAQYDDGATREQLTVLTGYKRSTRDAYVQRLREKGFVEPQGDRLYATDAGVDALGDDFEPLPTGSALKRYWIERLPEGERKVLESLIAHYPSSIDRSVIDDMTEYKRSSRDAYLQRLSSKRLIVIDGRGTVRASAQLFD